MDTTPKPTQKDALTWITNILTWTHQMPDGHADLIGLTGTWNIGTTRGSKAEDSLPFGLDHIIADPTTGPEGIRTVQSIYNQLTFLAWQASDSPFGLGQPGRDPGTWIRLKLDTPYPWETWEHWTTWASKLHAIWKAVRRITGNTPTPIGTCPKCGDTILRRLTTTGPTDSGTCTGCKTIYDLTGEDWSQSLNQLLRAPDINPDIHVTREELKTIWPGLTAKKLALWAFRDRVTKKDGYYNLADVNTCMTRTNKV